MHVYPAKLSRFESTDFASVMIDDVACSRRHQCPRCCNRLMNGKFSKILWKSALAHRYNTYCYARRPYWRLFALWGKFSKILWKSALAHRYNTYCYARRGLLAAVCALGQYHNHKIQQLFDARFILYKYVYFSHVYMPSLEYARESRAMPCLLGNCPLMRKVISSCSIHYVWIVHLKINHFPLYQVHSPNEDGNFVINGIPNRNLWTHGSKRHIDNQVKKNVTPPWIIFIWQYKFHRRGDP